MHDTQLEIQQESTHGLSTGTVTLNHPRSRSRDFTSDVLKAAADMDMTGTKRSTYLQVTTTIVLVNGVFWIFGFSEYESYPI